MNLSSYFRNIFHAVLKPSSYSKRGFSAVRDSRLEDWRVSYETPDAQLRISYQKLIARARDLAENDSFCVGYLRSLRRHVLGPHGLTLQSRAENRELRRQITDYWKTYGSTSEHLVSLDAHGGMLEFDWQVLRSLAVNGEAFIRRAWDESSPFGWRYELVDTLLVDPLYFTERTDCGGQIMMGVELDSSGREIAFHVRRPVMGNYMGGDRIRVPASDMLHVYRKESPYQTRGIPAAQPIIVPLFGLGSYEEAELTRARVLSCMMGVWEETGAGSTDLLGETDGNGVFKTRLEPGAIAVAPKGYRLSSIQGNSTNAQYSSYVKDVLRKASNALGLSYNKATGDYESVNYSSLREATLEDNESFAEVESFFTGNWKDFQFRDFLEALVWRGFLDSGDYSDALRHTFTGHRPHWVDPQRELAAKELETRLNLADPLSDLEAQGIDPEEHLDRLKQWREMLASRGLESPYAQPSPAFQSPEEDE